MNSEIFDTTVWPCHTPDLFWALSDTLDNIGRLVEATDDQLQYQMDDQNLPVGRQGLGKCEALRDFRIDLDLFPTSVARKIRSATLSFGSKALETVMRQDRMDLGEVLRFTMFTGSHILPNFVIDEPVSVSLECDFLTDHERSMLPRQAVRATGLLCTIRTTSKAFFVAASRKAILTWDGAQSHVVHTPDEPEVRLPQARRSSGVDLAKDLVVYDDNATPESLWKALQPTRPQEDRYFSNEDD